jgi:hypothetical protein
MLVKERGYLLPRPGSTDRYQQHYLAQGSGFFDWPNR